MEYEILTGENEGDLECQVRRAIDDGWLTYGYINVRHDRFSNRDVLSQAIIKGGSGHD